MAETALAAELRVEQWEDDFWKEYNRDSQFSPYEGTDENKIIQVKEELIGKPGATLTFSLVKQLTGPGVRGSGTLEGNEENMNNYGDEVSVDEISNAVLLQKMTEKRSPIDLRNAGKTVLKIWAQNDKRDEQIEKFYSPNLDGITTYANSSEANKDAWLAANADRILFGAAKSNNSSNDHSSSLANIDNTNDKLTPGNISLLKRMLKNATGGKVRPINVGVKGEWFVLFVGTYPFRDLKNNSTYATHLQQAMDRGKDNPLFTDGDLVWDGVIVKEVPEIPVIAGVGAGSIDVSANFMCGAQALAVAWGQRTKSVTKFFDYDRRWGCSINEIRGMKKCFFNSVQHGMGTLYTAAVADS